MSVMDRLMWMVMFWCLPMILVGMFCLVWIYFNSGNSLEAGEKRRVKDDGREFVILSDIKATGGWHVDIRYDDGIEGKALIAWVLDATERV